MTEQKTYTRTPVTTEAIKVPRIAKVTMAPKLEKKGFCEEDESKLIGHMGGKTNNNVRVGRRLTGERLKPD